MHTTDMHSIELMQIWAMPSEKTDISGTLPYDKTHLLLGRKDPDVIRRSSSSILGQTENIPDEFNEDGKNAVAKLGDARRGQAVPGERIMAAGSGMLLSYPTSWLIRIRSCSHSAPSCTSRSILAPGTGGLPGEHQTIVICACGRSNPV